MKLKLHVYSRTGFIPFHNTYQLFSQFKDIKWNFLDSIMFDNNRLFDKISYLLNLPIIWYGVKHLQFTCMSQNSNNTQN